MTLRNAWLGMAALLALLTVAMPNLATATQCVLMAIAAIGGTFLLGQVGLLSFAQASFFGSAAYGAGWAGQHFALGALGMLLAGVLAAAVVGLVVGAVATRRRGVYFIMMTLALGQLAYFLAYVFSDVTGGDNGMSGVPRPALLDGGDWSLDTPAAFYGLCVASLFVVYGVLHGVARSPFGSVLAAIRENEDRAVAAGYNVYAFKVGAMVISAMTVGVAGALYAMFLRLVPLTSIDFTMVEHLVLLTLVGGSGSLMGGVLGGVVYEVFSQVLVNLWDRWLLLLGVALIVVGVWFQGGVWGALERVAARVRTGMSRGNSNERSNA